MAPRSMRAASGILIAMLCALAGCGHSQPDSGAEQPPAAIVIVGQAVEQSIIDYVEYTGRTDAAESVEIRARVTGFLKAVRFKEGAEVEQGAALYEIDDREYQAALAAARADRASAMAHQEKATTDFKRMEALKQRNAASAEEYDRADAAKKEADAAVESTEARVIRAQLDVDFSKIAAPISGKISRTLISEGNLVNANITPLTTIVSVEPMYVYFDVDERTILTLKKQVRDGQLESKNDVAIPVLMGLTIDKDYPHEGTIDFIENRVDPHTGTVRVRGTFKNPRPEKGDRILDAGLFARIRVPVGRPKPALLVAERAIGTDQGQKFLYVVDEKNEVVFRPVRLGALHDGLRTIAEGLSAGERVIIDGLQRVRPGSVVEPKPGDMRSRPGGAVAARSGSRDKAEHADKAVNLQQARSAE
ncbi:MAG: efflux RND transporter periplasmic adaptor subunit [Planctomycetaceae bacterium]